MNPTYILAIDVTADDCRPVIETLASTGLSRNDIVVETCECSLWGPYIFSALEDPADECVAIVISREAWNANADSYFTNQRLRTGIARRLKKQGRPVPPYFVVDVEVVRTVTIESI